ncbi:MAG TPA: amidohydrolase family protein, partial [Burkholderiales bacterium]|nr:amidohydrolase family protein [Burkholderiales bacterium]
MHIADAQLHLWGANTPERPWPPGRERDAQRPYPISKEALLFQMDLANVSRAILVPPSWEGDRNDLALEAARQYPDRFAVMGRIALQDPSSRALLADWKKQPGMLGMRFTFHNEHNRHFLTDGTADWLWPAAERHSIPLMVLAPGSLESIGGIAERHPALRVVIDHVGLHVHGKAPKVLEDLPAVCALAKHPNVAVKASGLPAFSVQPYPFRDLHDAVRRLFDAFGPRRTFWGTDLTRMPCTYRECIDLFTRELPWLRDGD